jgi:hypothetical protein
VNIGSDHIKGSINAPVIILEYGDYECPYTGMAYPVVKEILRQFGDKIYFAFRNFPLNDNILMLSMPQKQLKLPRLKIDFGKCMITCLSIRKD